MLNRAKAAYDAFVSHPTTLRSPWRAGSDAQYWPAKWEELYPELTGPWGAVVSAVLRAAGGAALVEVVDELARQRAKGWDLAHDVGEHANEDLARVAAVMLLPDGDARSVVYGPKWGLGLIAKHRGNRRRQLVIGVALGLAELLRWDAAAEDGGARP